MFTTISTVGYGSSINSEIGRVSTCVFIAIEFAIVPTLCSRLVELLNEKSEYARNPYKSMNVPHIVLIGAVSITSLKNFMEEYFHDDHGSDIKHLVLMKGQRPNADIEMMLLKTAK